MKIAPGNDQAHYLGFAAAGGHFDDQPQPVFIKHTGETAPDES